MKKISLFAVTLVTAFFLLSNLPNKNKIILLDEKEISDYYKEVYKEAIEEANESEDLEKANAELKETKTQIDCK